MWITYNNTKPTQNGERVSLLKVVKTFIQLKRD